MREILLDDMVGQTSQVLMLPAVVEHFKGSEPDMRRSHTNEHGSGFDRLAPHLRIAPNDAQRTCGRYPQPVHRLAAEILANSGAQDSPPVAVS